MLLGLQLLGGISQCLGVAVEPCGVVAVLIRFLTGVDAGLLRSGGDSANAG